MSDVVQWLIVSGIVLASALYMAGRIVPHWRRRLALHLQQPRYAHWVNRLGVRLSTSAGCGSCDSCGACAPPNASVKK